MAPGADQILWIYAVLDVVPARLPRAGIGGGAPRLVSSGDLVAVVERLAERPSPVPGALAAQDRVVRAVAELVPAILPARFGEVAGTESELTRLLRDSAGRLAASLDRVRGCVQVTTRLLPGAGRERREADSGGGEGGAATEELGPGRRFLRDRLRARQVPELDELRRGLESLVAATRCRPGPAPAIASAYHLVTRERADEVVRRARHHAAPAGTSIVVSPPAPPYAFAGMVP